MLGISSQMDSMAADAEEDGNDDGSMTLKSGLD